MRDQNPMDTITISENKISLSDQIFIFELAGNTMVCKLVLMLPSLKKISRTQLYFSYTANVSLS